MAAAIEFVEELGQAFRVVGIVEAELREDETQGAAADVEHGGQVGKLGADGLIGAGEFGEAGEKRVGFERELARGVQAP